jgi:hypothetical protein
MSKAETRGIYAFDHLNDGPIFTMENAGDTHFLCSLWVVNRKGENGIVRMRLFVDEDGDLAFYASGGVPDGVGDAKFKMAMSPLPEDDPK